MATVAQEVQASNGKPAAAPAPVVKVRTTALTAEDSSERFLKRQVPAWMISGGIHLLLTVIFLIFASLNRAADRGELESQVLETRVEDGSQKWNFDNTEVGLDPNKETNYNVDRIDNLSVPGKFKPDDPVGIDGAPDGPSLTVPPPPGFGGGQGGGLKGDATGPGQMFGEAGGWLGGRSLPGVAFAGRSAATRKKMLEEGGGNAASEAAVAKGLKWLQRQQKGDGRWILDGQNYTDDVAATSLALLPFLAAGQTHRPLKGEKESPYARTVQYALDFLKSKQKANGSFGGFQMYGDTIAVMTLCEAYGMTQDPTLKKPAQMGLDYLVKAQHAAGGFRYRPQQAGDTSVTGWCVQALKSGSMAGLSVPRDVFYKVEQFLDAVQSQDGAAYGYTGPGAIENLTAVGLLCRQYLGWGTKNPKLAAGVENLKKRLPGQSRSDIYFNYYATQVMHFFGGDDWDKVWNPRMRNMLVDTQDNTTAQATSGSWAPDSGTTGRSGGRITVTCLSLLTLEVYYRYLPLYKKDNSGLLDI